MEDQDLNRFSYKECIVHARHLSRQELEEVMKEQIRRYYFRWDYVRWLIRRMIRFPQMFRKCRAFL